jgi:stachydrine N-demethylase
MIPSDTLGLMRNGQALPRALYLDPALYAAEMAQLFERDWCFAGHSCEVAMPGDWMTLTVGRQPLVILRGADGVARAFHNLCRHRGHPVCLGDKGHAAKRIVCPYHQWSYGLDGALVRARDMGEDFDPSALGLKQAHCREAAGLIFVCVSPIAPPFDTFAERLEAYLGPYRLDHAKIAHESRIVEGGNWKIVWENNRECYHCRSTHPELCRTFPEAPTHSGGGSTEEQAAVAAMAAACETLSLPSAFLLAENGQYRLTRIPFEDGARSMTMTGKAACAKLLIEVPPEIDTGDLLLFHFPTMWSHFQADHAVTFRLTPVSQDKTELRTTWLVRADALEGVDYDVKTLCEVWHATNAQDRALIEATQGGVSSPAYQGGPLSMLHEDGVMQFHDWYRATLGLRLGRGGDEVAAPPVTQVLANINT